MFFSLSASEPVSLLPLEIKRTLFQVQSSCSHNVCDNVLK